MFLDTFSIRNAIHNCMQLKQRFLSLPNTIKKCCGRGEMVSGASGGEFDFACDRHKQNSTP